MRKTRRSAGSLTAVGTGYLFGAHVTTEARISIEKAEKLFYVVSDRLTENWLRSLNPTAETLSSCYAVGKDRRLTYEEMVERTLAPVRAGHRVCLAFYGHPAVCSFPPREAVRRARREGFDAVILPGISAEDCLYADLNIDPSAGCQSFEATNFVVRRHKPDATAALILWQVGQIGVSTYLETELWSRKGLRILTELLRETYPAKHKVTIYETNFSPLSEPRLNTVTLGQLSRAPVTVGSLLYVPPLYSAPIDEEMKQRLGYG